MIVSFEQFKSDDLYILGDADVPVFLLRVADDQWVLVDAGLQERCEKVWLDLTAIVKNLSTISHWFVTHSHYDHCGLLPLLLPQLPNVQVIASHGAASAWKKEKNVALIENLNSLLNDNSSKNSKWDYLPYPDISVQTVEDGDALCLHPTCTVNVIATAGHSRDQVAYEFPSSGYLFVADALGELTSDEQWNPLIFDDAKDYLLSIARLASSTVKWIITGHNYAIERNGQIEKAFASTMGFIDQILEKKASNEDLDQWANYYSELWSKDSISFMPDGLHLKSMQRLISCIIKYNKAEFKKEFKEEFEALEHA